MLFNTLYTLILPLHQSSRGDKSICTSLFTTLPVGISQGQSDLQIYQDLTPPPRLLVIPSYCWTSSPSWAGMFLLHLKERQIPRIVPWKINCTLGSSLSARLVSFLPVPSSVLQQLDRPCFLPVLVLEVHAEASSGSSALLALRQQLSSHLSLFWWGRFLPKEGMSEAHR